MKPVEQLLTELAQTWKHESRPTLRVIGSNALMLRTDYTRGTKDSDVLETAQLDAETKARLLRLAGRNTVLAARWRMYLEIVPNGLRRIHVAGVIASSRQGCRHQTSPSATRRRRPPLAARAPTTRSCEATSRPASRGLAP